jgi:hypothetical protein
MRIVPARLFGGGFRLGGNLELYPDSEFARDYRRTHPDYEPRPAEAGVGPWPGIKIDRSQAESVLGR